MSQWYVKDLSQLTGVSVQTLHHYDRIDLLKPSGRLPNGYRVYSEGDLLQLQQIVALKFFGFELSKIKALDAYWRKRIDTTLNQIGKISLHEALTLRDDILEDMYGKDADRKKTVYALTIKDDNISENAKQWLKDVMKERNIT